MSWTPGRRAVICALFMVAALMLPGCYFVQLAAGQLALINEQRPLPLAVAAEQDPERRRLLQLAPDVRSFGRTVLQLRPGRNYTGYVATEAEAIVFVVVASEKTRFEPYRFWFPIVGSVEYKSYFGERDAREAARELEERGYDAYVARATAYSTLGFFRDPITTLMLRNGEAGFVEVLLHEMAHARLFVAGQTEWNEQLASFVGLRGVEHYFRSRYGGDPARAAELAQHLARRAEIDALTGAAIDELERIYASRAGAAELLRAREPVFARVAGRLARLYPDATAAELKVNNARLLQYRRYRANDAALERLWDRAGGSWVRFWRLCERHAASL